MTDNQRSVVAWIALAVTLLINWTVIIVYVERLRADNLVQDVIIGRLLEDVNILKSKVLK